MKTQRCFQSSLLPDAQQDQFVTLGSRISHHGQTPGPQGSRVQVDQIRGSQSDGQKFLQLQGGYSLQDSPQVAVRAGKGQPADQDRDSGTQGTQQLAPPPPALWVYLSFKGKKLCT